MRMFTRCVQWPGVGIVFLMAAAALLTTPARGQAPPGRSSHEPASPKPDLTARAGAGLRSGLARFWPEHPEWLAMFADILQGSRLGPQEGWFRKAVRQSRYPWAEVARRYDGDSDGRIERGEFPGTDRDFRRLDRDRDGMLTSGDLEWPEHALVQSPGMMLYYMSDHDGNGKVTREEFDRLFEMLDSEQTGFASLDDMKGLLTPPRPSAAGRGRDDGPTRSTLVKGLFQQEIGALRSGPAVGEHAPDFTLRTVDGKQEVVLSERFRKRPVVLIFGNFTCGPFRMQAGNVEKLYRRYQDRAEFLMIYVREAHPTDGWHMPGNDRYGVTLPQPRSYTERVGVAQTCQKTLAFGMPFLVDSIDDMVGGAYSGMPSRLYVIDTEGKVAYKSGRGPFGFKPAEMEQSLILLLTELSGAGEAESRPAAEVETSKEPAGGRAP
jgi:Iodothyronine deiodinase/EF hand